MPSLTSLKMLIITKTYELPLPNGTVVTDKTPAHKTAAKVHSLAKVAMCYKKS